MNVSIEKKKAEAVKRMRKLGIFGPTIKQFEKEGLVSISEPPAGAFFWVEGEELEEMREWEKKHNALVYVIVRSYTTLGKMDAYLYVSDYEEEWQEDNECLKEGEVLDELMDDLTEKFPSLSRCDEWITKERHAVLENKLFYIALEDNEWAMAVELIQKESDYDDRLLPLQKRHYENYLKGIKDALFNQFDTLGTYSGAWTHTIIHKEENQ